MKKLFFKLTLVLLIFYAANETYAQSAIDFGENVAIIDIQAVSNSSGKYFYEIKVVNFSKIDYLKDGFSLNGHTYSDNGKYNDKKAGDKVYSSLEEVTAEKLKQNPITKTVYYDKSFNHLNDIKVKVSQKGVGCDFERCGCPCSNGVSCEACEEFGWDCWKLSGCFIELPFA